MWAQRSSVVTQSTSFCGVLLTRLAHASAGSGGAAWTRPAAGPLTMSSATIASTTARRRGIGGFLHSSDGAASKPPRWTLAAEPRRVSSPIGRSRPIVGGVHLAPGACQRFSREIRDGRPRAFVSSRQASGRNSRTTSATSSGVNASVASPTVSSRRLSPAYRGVPSPRRPTACARLRGGGCAAVTAGLRRPQMQMHHVRLRWVGDDIDPGDPCRRPFRSPGHGRRTAPSSAAATEGRQVLPRHTARVRIASRRGACARGVPRRSRPPRPTTCSRPAHQGPCRTRHRPVEE